MSDFGLSGDGFNRQRLNEVIDQIQTAITAAFGAVNLDPDSVLGELTSIVAVPIAELWMQAENVYHSQYPSTAEGTSLDNAVDLVGIARLPATNTRVVLALTGLQATAIPAGSIAEVPETGETFVNLLPGVITRTNAVRVTSNIAIVADSTVYAVNISGNNIQITSGIGVDAADIALALVNEINTTVLPFNITATDNLDGTFIVSADTNDDAFNFQVGTGIAVLTATSPILFQAVNTGPVLALANSVTEIVTPVAGWQSVSNIEDGVVGRNVETDQELRLRRLQSLRVVGSGSVEAIRARLRQNVENVLNAFVFENREPFEVNGRPPHSFEAIVIGGADADIAEELWQNKPAGIQTFGNVTVLITDSNGDSQAISFSRPEPVYIWVNVELRVNPGVFPSSGVDAVSLAIKAFGDTFNVGEKIIYQQFFGPIYSVAGILEVEVLEFATSATPGGPPGAYTSANVPITSVEVGDFDLSRISVTI